jgi:hypothetical protein
MPKTRKLTLLFTAGDTHVVSDKPRSKDEVAMSTGIDPATLVAPATATTVVDVSDDDPAPAALAKTNEPPERNSDDSPFRRKFERKPIETADRPLIGTRKSSRFRRQESSAPPEVKPSGTPPGPNPILESK